MSAKVSTARYKNIFEKNEFKEKASRFKMRPRELFYHFLHEGYKSLKCVNVYLTQDDSNE